MQFQILLQQQRGSVTFSCRTIFCQQIQSLVSVVVAAGGDPSPEVIPFSQLPAGGVGRTLPGPAGPACPQRWGDAARRLAAKVSRGLWPQGGCARGPWAGHTGSWVSRGRGRRGAVRPRSELGERHAGGAGGSGSFPCKRGCVLCVPSKR